MDKALARKTRGYITPYAYSVADDLIGTPLASPYKRGAALLLDLTVIGLLAMVHGLILACLCAWVFIRAARRLERGRNWLRALAALIMIGVLIGLIAQVTTPRGAASDGDTSSGHPAGGMQRIGMVFEHMPRIRQVQDSVDSGACAPPVDCWLPLARQLVDEIVDTSASPGEAEQLMHTFTDVIGSGLADEERQTLLQTMRDRYHEATREQTIQPPGSQAAATDSASGGPFGWLRNLVDDIGIGFGWAAFYFTVLTAWWHGQTPGKRLLGLRVVKLDGRPMNLWESLERYGGYGAGLATGLLGFSQIFWDHNRQAIQDKISETLVIDLRRPATVFTDTELRYSTVDAQPGGKGQAAD